MLALRHVGEDRGILERDADLVVEAVQHPAPTCTCAAAAVHGDVQGMVDVVAHPLARSFSSNSRLLHAGSQLDLHSVVRDLDPGGLERGAFRAVLVQDRIGVVDVNEDLARREGSALRACRPRRSGAGGPCRARARGKPRAGSARRRSRTCRRASGSRPGEKRLQVRLDLAPVRARRRARDACGHRRSARRCCRRGAARCGAESRAAACS